MKTLKEKLGPFPLWVWLAGITALGLGYYLYEQHLAETTASSSTSSTTSSTGSVPQFVIQNQYPVTAPSGSSGASKTVGATAGYTEVSEAEAEKDKKEGAKVMYLDKAGLLKSWAGKGSHPGASLWVPTEWATKHKSGSGKSGPGSPNKVTGPKAAGGGTAKAPVKPASTHTAAHRSVASSKAKPKK